MDYDFFLAHAGVDAGRALELHGRLQSRGFEVFLDSVVLHLGDAWDRLIPEALRASRVCVVLMSRAGVDEGFYDRAEVVLAIQRFREKKLRVVPVFLDECETRYGLEPLHAGRYGGDWTPIVDALAKLPGVSARVRAPKSPSGPAPDQVSISRLPHVGAGLFGRAAELARLHAAWNDAATHVITVVAAGGVGKTALVKRWVTELSAAGWPGAERVYAWSFYSQGTGEGRQASGDLFIDQALRWFGDPKPEAGGPNEKGERLAALVRQRRTLLILDGIEPLQHPPGPLGGQLKDPAVRTLLEELAGLNPGLCVVSSRLAIEDLADATATAPVVELGPLASEAGAELLRKLKVDGEEDELRAASEELGGHALSVYLLGNYLRERFAGDARRRREVPALCDAERGGDHARKVMAAYEAWLPKAELGVLRLLGLFDRPAPKDLAEAVRPTVAALSARDWDLALSHLADLGLLSRQPDGALDTHPLVREHFGARLRETDQAAWTAGHLRLYEVLCTQAPDLPDTLDQMEPLLQAIRHGCAAGRHQEVLGEVFVRRVLRGPKFYLTKRLGAFAAYLAALASVFLDPWERPQPTLTEAAQAFVLGEAGFALRSLGRLSEAMAPMAAGFARRIASEDWRNAAVAASNLSELLLALGRIPGATERARDAVAHADQSGDGFQRLADRTALADALHAAGSVDKARTLFAEAERMQGKWEPTYSLLYSLAGFRFGDLLLTVGERTEARRRAYATAPIHRRHGWLLPIALDHLLRGRAAHALGDHSAAGLDLDEAVSRLRRAGQHVFIVRALLARAAFRRDTGDLPGAQHDLDEATRIARRGGMRLFLADCTLERARLAFARGEVDAARAAREEARREIEAMGYHRRDPELEALDALG